MEHLCGRYHKWFHKMKITDMNLDFIIWLGIAAMRKLSIKYRENISR